MTAYSSTFRVATSGQTLVLASVKDPAGTTIPVFTDTTLTAAVTLPFSFSADTSFYSAWSGVQATVVVQQPDGTALGPGGSYTFPLHRVPGTVLTPKPTVDQMITDEAANIGTFIPQAGGVFPVESYGTVDTTGATASDAAVQAAITAWHNSANGGTILFPAGTVRCDLALLIPNDGATPPRQKYLALKGQGSWAFGKGSGAPMNPAGGTILDLRYPGRVDAGCGTTSGLPTVTDAAITAADFGLPVVGTGVPANSFVGTVTPGVSFLLSSVSGTQTNVNATATGTVSLTIEYAKIDTRGFGLLVLDALTITDLGTSSNPFVYTSCTTVKADSGDLSVIGNPSKSLTSCDQDAFMFGGSNNVTEYDTTANSPFQGYGTRVSGVFFNRIRRGGFLRTYANGIQFEDCTFWQECGSNLADGGAIDLDPSGNAGAQSIFGNVITGNLIEVGQYPYGIRLDYAEGNQIQANNFYDQTAATKAYIGLMSTHAKFNTIVGGYGYVGGAWPGGLFVYEQTPGQNTVYTGSSNVPQQSVQPVQYLRGIQTSALYNLGAGNPEITLAYGTANPPSIYVIYTGSPLGVIAAKPGSLCLSMGGGAGTTLFVKESATDATGWVGK